VVKTQRVTARLFAAARASAGGVDEVQLNASTLGELIAELEREFGSDLGRILAACSFLIDGVAVKDRSAHVGLSDGVCVDVLPPFAGG